ncbi:uncharacterized protein LOC123202867 [Mangifera indica]|uniref:uncharacterized protein LOC123202867 n=1 Tax=Mangifera indica TaxID=29780 RepID=UPI001CF97BDF|nr:uncharacterized protein LOC123202867 [Mangifera indica]
MYAHKTSMAFHHNSPPLMIITQVFSISFLLLIHSLLPALALVASSNNGPSSLVRSVCEETSQCSYKDCVAALALDPKALSTTNVRLLAKIALNLAISNSTNSLKYIDAMAKKEKSSPRLKSALEFCISQYQYTVNSFKSALSDLDVDPMTANYDAKVASDGAYYCADKLKSEGFQSKDVDSVRARNNHVLIYSDIGYTVTNKMR